MYYIYVKHLVRNKHISFGFISFRNITWVSYKLKLKFFGHYLVPKHKVSNMSAINNIEFKTTIKVVGRGGYKGNPDIDLMLD